MAAPFFPGIEKIPFLGPDTNEPLAFRYYDKDRVIAERRMEDHLRLAVCYWHTFCWGGDDVFGSGTFSRPWQAPGGDPIALAEHKLTVAFEFFEKLGVPFFCFHDRDLAPEGDSIAESAAILDRFGDLAAEEMERTGVKLLWGTANLFGHPRYAAGAATNPNPEVFACAAAQVKHCLELTHRLDGANYVMWGGREGYETLLNTDLRREGDQLGRFMNLVVEHKHRIGFEGVLLIEPKPHEPTQHQYDHDVATVYAFLQKYGLESEIKLNIEVNHATLAGHSFQHEVALALANDVFGSVDANRGDPQNGWDTDQFPNDPIEIGLALYEVLRGGGLTTGGFNFDAKLRRQSMDPVDLFHAHVGGMDTLAEALLFAERLLDQSDLQRFVDERYAGWDTDVGRDILDGKKSLADLEAWAREANLDPAPTSGRQERLENLVRRARV
ncbi:MAG: xylose isomerase [Deltaproteobacteria bacterium]|nr:xylose isomerase [Deltaproteobacteria bacterium]